VTAGADAPNESHVPVMVAEVTELLRERRIVVDMTLGAGGHAAALLDAGVGRGVGVDRDPAAIAAATTRLANFGPRFRAVQARFSEVTESDVGAPVDGVLFDLGASSLQLDEPARGFSFRRDAALDMRMGPGKGEEDPSAADLANTMSERELADVIFRYGDERRSRRIAAAIVRRRPIRSTDELAGIVVSVVGRRPGGPHPARRTFQALRIAVNRELEELAASLPRAVRFLGPGGRVVAIAYHSLEDGLVKRMFRENERVHVLTKKPRRPAPSEVASNPRARSARLRAAERIPDAA
jgi:16S rRNA (cytosine1402-N4)-methyltransferase